MEDKTDLTKQALSELAETVERYNAIKKRVEEACRRAGRDPREVTVVAVSKTKPDWMVEELAAAGVLDFGENKPQELKRKHDEILPDAGLRWHMIGNIQTNKVKMFVGRACLIHSVPDLHIAQAVSAEAVKRDVTAPVLIEVNIADEATKHGLAAQDLAAALGELVREAAALPGLEIRGLMAIAPPVDDPEENRPYFRRLRELRDALRAETIPGAPMTELSMGMTGDFEVAVEEGATFVRVGTAIFGERDYSNTGA